MASTIGVSKKKIDNSIYVLGLITLFGTILRIYHLGFKPLWFDEAVIYWISNSSNIGEIIAQNALRNSAPPLFVLLISIILKIGDSEVMLRLIPMLAGIASIPALFFLSRQFMGKFPAYVTAFLVAVAPNQVKYSQDLREYSLTFLLATLILIVFIRNLQKPSKKNLIFMTLLMVFGVLLQYGLSILIISLNIIYLYELITNEENLKSNFLGWAASQGIILGTAIFVIFLSLGDQMAIGFGSHYLSPTYWNGSVSSLFSFTIVNTFSIFLFAFSEGTFLFLSIFGFIISLYNKTNLKLLMVFIVPMVLTLGLALGKLYPYGGCRQTIFLTPMIYVLAGLGIHYLLNFLLKFNKKRLDILLMLVLLFPIMSGFKMTWNYLNSPGSENIRPVVKALSESFQKSEIIYVYYSAQPAFTYYYRDNSEFQIIGTSSRGSMNNYYLEIDEILLKNDPVWLVFSHCYSDECKLILDYFSGIRKVDLIVRGNDALYYVHRN